jgi:hypothetical protein
MFHLHVPYLSLATNWREFAPFVAGPHADSSLSASTSSLGGSEHLIVIQLKLELEKMREASAAAIRELKDELHNVRSRSSMPLLIPLQ